MKQKRRETREERFKRVAERRTSNILKQLQYLGNCSNKSMYSYNEREAKRIINTIREALRRTEAKFFKIKVDFKLDR